MLFFTIGAIYLVYLVYLLIRAYSELRAMPYFGKQLFFLLISDYRLILTKYVTVTPNEKLNSMLKTVTTNSLLYSDLYISNTVRY